MDITVTVRHCEVPDRFRRHLAEKVEKVEQLAPRTRRVAAVISYEPNRRLTPVAWCIELTVLGAGPVVRAEASAEDPYAALDLASAKVGERLRRVHDRKRVHHGRHTPESLTTASARWGYPAPVPAPLAAPEDATAPDPAADGADAADGSPITIREKTHDAEPMTLDQAMYEMELVGHDFYLFVDEAVGVPSVVYRRKGWSYGVIRLRSSPESPEGPVAPASSPELALR